MFFDTFEEYKKITPGLSRIKKFFENIGNPHKKLKIIHIAGTNGKGSTAAFISSICIEAGYKTALYTSPHLINITERIKINNIEISKKKFDDLSKKYLINALKYSLSYFEYLTSLAFIYFVDSNVDIAIVEVGLGGIFDATNIIEMPLICIITSISKDHQEILGNEIKKITFEKAGIIKNGSYTVCGKLPIKAIEIIKDKSIPYIYGTDFKYIKIIHNYERTLREQRFNYVSTNTKFTDLRIRLLGDHQLINASIAIFASELLCKSGYCLNEINIKHGLYNAVWKGRFDVRKIIWKNKTFRLIIDGSHNIEGINTFFKTFKQLKFSREKRIFIFAIMKEKKYEYIVKKIAFFAKKIILLKINNDRAIDRKILKLEFSKYIDSNMIFMSDSIENIFDSILNNELIVSIGSLYLSGELLKYV
ncbi:MAG: hypothetical protein LBH27_01990 [Endomicrobium sp.]|jgi:dihydrofolate synthase/folylpolyglutamate synthase|nr:hypothetical protein [Endomicrobium sp.]